MREWERGIEPQRVVWSVRMWLINGCAKLNRYICIILYCIYESLCKREFSWTLGIEAGGSRCLMVCFCSKIRNEILHKTWYWFWIRPLSRIEWRISGKLDLKLVLQLVVKWCIGRKSGSLNWHKSSFGFWERHFN